MARICNILVVEDDDSVRALLGDVLDHAGYEFTLARDGAEMRAALDGRAVRPRDYRYLAARRRGRVRARRGGERKRMQRHPDDRRSGAPVRLEASGRRHLMKPFRMKQLTDLIDEILRDDAALCTRRPSSGPAFCAQK